MSQHYKQMQGHNEARSELHKRLAREEMGDEAYDRMISSGHDPAFSMSHVVVFMLVAAALFAAVWLGN